MSAESSAQLLGLGGAPSSRDGRTGTHRLPAQRAQPGRGLLALDPPLQLAASGPRAGEGEVDAGGDDDLDEASTRPARWAAKRASRSDAEPT
ncbi:MAG: hypothetical protein M3P85_06420 [Actinomycetota bacterium]|nr:hypothetical protein [Actinomycetota bacterium]